LWEEVQSVISQVNATKCKTKVSKEKTMTGKLLYSPIEMNNCFRLLLRDKDWQESRVSYWVTKSEKLIRVIRQGRGVPAVPLVIVGIEP
ncbi:MAG: hypothetical protein ACREAB_00030, partial [Blastocatellia bacterium]